MPEIVQPAVEVQAITKARGLPVLDAIWALFVAEARGGNPVLVLKSVEVLGARLSELLGMADLMGRRRVAIATSRLPPRPGAPTPPPLPPTGPPSPPPPPPVPPSGGGGSGTPFGRGRPGIIPNVRFDEAVADIATRYPTVVPPNVRTLGPQAVQEWIGGVYETKGFTLAKTTQDVVTRRVRDIVARAKKEGVTREKAVQQIISAGKEHGDAWTRGYAETVWRNNSTTAYNAGIHEQMREESTALVIGALQFMAIGGRGGDGDTTPVCKAAHGTLAPEDHGVWNERTPGLHHNCRSGLIFVTWADLERMNALDAAGNVIPNIPPFPPGVAPQPGFGGRG